MQNSAKLFNATITAGGFKDKSISVRAEETTDGVPLYHCDVDGESASQLRQEPSGEWIQVWGELPVEMVAQLGRLIEAHQR